MGNPRTVQNKAELTGRSRQVCYSILLQASIENPDIYKIIFHNINYPHLLRLNYQKNQSNKAIKP